MQMKNPLSLSIRPVLFQEAALLILLPFLLVFASTQDSLTEPQLLILSGGVFTILFIGLLAFRARSVIWIELPVAACFLVLVLTSVTSIDPRRSFIEAWLISVELFLFLFFVNLTHKKWKPDVIIRTLLIVGAIFMALSWGEVWQWYRGWLASHPGQWLPEESYRLPAPNFICVVLNVWLMLAAARFWLCDSKAEKFLLGLYSVSSLVLIYLTSSRGGWIGTMAGFGTLVLSAIYLAPEKWLALWSKIRQVRGGVAGVVFVLLAGLALFSWLIIRQDFQPSHSPLLESRNYLWGPAWHAFLSSPALGKGPFTFVSHYLQENSVPPGYYFDYAHSIYLDILSSSGVLGFAVAGWLGFAILRRLVKSMRAVETPVKAVLVGAIGAMAAFGVHGLFDSVHHTVPSSAWNLAIILGTATGAATYREGAAAAKEKFPLVPTVIGLAAVAGFFASAWLTSPMAAGVEAAAQGSWQAAGEHFAAAVGRDSLLAVPHQQAGMSSSMLFEQSGETVDLEQAIDSFEEAVRLDPHWALNHANLGALYAAAGEWEAALAQYREAARLAPRSGVYQLNLGGAYEELEDEEKALEAYAAALDQNPYWKTAGYWDETELRQAFLERWLLEHSEEPYSLEELRTLYLNHPNSPEVVKKFIQALLADGDIVEAEKVYQESRSYGFLAYQGVERQWLGAEIAAKNGDLETATTLGRSAVDTLRNQGIPGPGFGLSAAYANYMFRSKAVGQDAVPQMPRIIFTKEWEERLSNLARWYRELGQDAEADVIGDLRDDIF